MERIEKILENCRALVNGREVYIDSEDGHSVLLKFSDGVAIVHPRYEKGETRFVPTGGVDYEDGRTLSTIAVYNDDIFVINGSGFIDDPTIVGLRRQEVVGCVSIDSPMPEMLENLESPLSSVYVDSKIASSILEELPWMRFNPFKDALAFSTSDFLTGVKKLCEVSHSVKSSLNPGCLCELCLEEDRTKTVEWAFKDLDSPEKVVRVLADNATPYEDHEYYWDMCGELYHNSDLTMVNYWTSGNLGYGYTLLDGVYHFWILHPSGKFNPGSSLLKSCEKAGFTKIDEKPFYNIAFTNVFEVEIQEELNHG